ncbi:MAG: transcription-repair coupling factor [Verrucomicrobiota bacterium]
MASFPEPVAAENLLARVLTAPAIQDLPARVEKGGLLSLDTVHPAAQPFLTILLKRLLPNRPVVVVTEGLKAQEIMHQDVITLLGTCAPALGNQGNIAPAASVLFYPAWEMLPHEAKLPHADVISERLESLLSLMTLSSGIGKGVPLLVTCVTALLQRTFPPEYLRQNTRILRRGDRMEPLDLIEWLETQGYEPEVQVSHKGELALRGGIVDVYPLTSPWPVRLEFFGDELESLRYFDPHTQISREPVEAISLPPAGELGVIKQLVRQENPSPVAPIPGSTPDKAADNSEIRIPKSEIAGGRLLASTATRAGLATLLDYLPPETVFVLCEPETLDTHAGHYQSQVPAGDPFFLSWDAFRAQLTARGMTMLELRHDAANFQDVVIAVGDSASASAVLPEQPPDLFFESLDAYRPVSSSAPEAAVAETQRKEFFQQLHRWLRQGYAVHVFCNNAGERQRFDEIWRELGLAETDDVRPATHLGALARGFLFEAARVVVVTDAEVFGRYKVQRPRRLKSPHAAVMRSALDIDFTEFEEGDYVVHLQHGIGRFAGLKTLESSPTRADSKRVTSTFTEECLAIEYAPATPGQSPPVLYVPVSEAHLVSKYVGAGKARPPLNMLGGTRWAKTKSQAEHAVRDMAAGMLSIQAARETQAGYAYPLDTPWQREFESAFLYEETPDQLQAIAETKRDLEVARPMDRLICGDVGFGKTEVAIRAAFKAVMSGKQVAVLVPTTVLAQQHFNTFRERMADYPVRVELLSRYRTRREQTRVMEQLATGGVDVVVGTHRLVQSDIVFKDLGLVVVDEEQRFGVLHKEKLKRLRTMVDVLTLSATPIPRTLYLALTGARDMSKIETPPQDRLPVETVVAQYDERLVRDVIQRELNREGQVFYLHNRVFDIESVAQRLKQLLPKARIVVGHGQMEADDLEDVMTQFVNGEADVLVSTTIIESGLDIPNANTIIIDRADRFGLSDLYQLRGRVGRYKHQAYAYLLLPRHATLLSDARKRISAIRQYSKLGSGFKIAMRDLEIRGAGNLLGSQQSGHIAAVGFDLYCQLLKQSVAKLKGEPVKPRLEVVARIDFLALSPGEEGQAEPVRRARSKADDLPVNIPREVATFVARDEVVEMEQPVMVPRNPGKTPAYLPLDYIRESKLRIEAYRKLAEITNQTDLEQLRKEWRDRFGPAPEAVELLLLLHELKLRAAEKNITIIETREDKLMLTRNNDYITAGSRFPRLEKRSAKARLNEIKRWLGLV